MAFLKEIHIDTGKQGFYNITETVAYYTASTGVKDGIAVIYCPHTTAGITINENADPDVKSDMSYALNRVFPEFTEFAHAEGNSDAHVKSTLTGAHACVIISGGKLLLGTWQGIYFAEYDGPRSRRYVIKVIEG